MCGRYALYELQDFNKRFLEDMQDVILEPTYNAAPGQYLPVIVNDNGKRKVETMKWGLVPVWAKDEKIGYKMINARAESVFDKPAWRGPIKHHRALVPANGFYEWQQRAGQKTKQPYFIHPKDQGLFAFAGMYEVKKDINGQPFETFSIITTNANDDMAPIHDRMPVILHPDQEPIWLDQEIEDRDLLAEMLRPYEDNKLEMYEVSTDVNVAKNNDSHLVLPVNSQ